MGHHPFHPKRRPRTPQPGKQLRKRSARRHALPTHPRIDLQVYGH